MVDQQTRIDSINNQLDKIAGSIELDAIEDRHMHVMYQLLHELSETKNQEAENFYTGNMPIQIENLLTIKKNTHQANSPVIQLPQQKYYQVFRNKTRVGGNDIKEIDKSLSRFSKRHFKLSLAIPLGRTNQKGQEMFDYVVQICPLFIISKIYPSVTGEEIVSIEDDNPELVKGKGEFRIQLHPIFAHLLKNNYINFPHDLYPRIQEALGGGKKQTVAISQLKNWLFKHLRNIKADKCPDCIEINDDNLNRLLGLEKKIKNREHKKANEIKIQAIEVFKKLGLIISHEEGTGKNEQRKHKFHINKDWE